jgi:hypothetical protein
MSLANILNEPKKELTESALGIIAVSIAASPAAVFAYWFAGKMQDEHTGWGFCFFLGFSLALFGYFLMAAIVAFTHFVGEQIVKAYQQRQQRQQRRWR